MKTETTQEILNRPTTEIEIERTETTTTYVEKPKYESGGHNKELQELLDREAPELPRVVVRCDRQTGEWKLFKNDKAWKAMRACVLINVSFSCEWQEGEHQGCGYRSSDGEYVGYAAGDLLPIATPLTVPTEGVVGLRFDPDTGKFYNKESGLPLSGSGYLILKEGCSSEYVNASAIGAQNGDTANKPKKSTKSKKST